MNFIVAVIILYISYIIGLFGFVQIIGSIRIKQEKYYITIAIRTLILSNYIIAFYIGTIISFIVAFSKKSLSNYLFMSNLFKNKYFI